MDSGPHIQPTADSATWVRLGRVEDLKGRGPFALSADGLDLVVVRTPTGLKAYEGRCPHQGALLGEGQLDGDTLVCRNHQWRFDTRTGLREGGQQCLAGSPLDVRQNELWADVSAIVAAGAGEPGIAATRSLDDLPGPRGLPVLGNLHQLELSRLHEILEEWAARYGLLFTYRFAGRRALGVADPALIEQIMRARPEAYRRLSTVEPVFEELGIAGVFSAEGAPWRRQRRLAMAALSHRNLRDFYPTLKTVVERLRDRWVRQADGGVELDAAEEMKRFTVDVTTLLVLGHDVDSIGKDADVIQRKLEQVFPALNRRLFAMLPTWRWFRTRADRRLDRALDELRLWLGELISEARARLGAEPERADRPKNFLEFMVAAEDAEGAPFPDDVIYGNLLQMLLAGEDTTAYTLAWAVHHLCDAPDAVAHLRAEADELMGGGTVPPDIGTAEQLAYAGAVASEAMRLRPVAPLIILEANHEVRVGDVAVPKGTWIATLTRPGVVDPHNFGDPMGFRPERWLQDRGVDGVHESATLMPFGTGPRICPGRSLALLEMKVVLAMLYSQFEVERVGEAAAVSEQFAFTMSPKGLRVRLHSRARVQRLTR